MRKIIFDVKLASFNICFYHFKYLYVKHILSLQDYLKIKPRLCWVKNNVANGYEVALIKCYDELTNMYLSIRGNSWKHATMLTDDEIKEYLNNE